MSQVQGIVDLTQIKEPQEFMRFASQAIGNIANTVNGQLEFVANIHAYKIDVTAPGTANTDIQINHNLNNKSPKWLVIDKDATCDVYRSSTQATANTFYLKCTAASTKLSILVF